VSSRNPDTRSPGDAQHLRELTPEELAAALGRRFVHVAAFGQTSWLATLLAPLDADGEPLPAAGHSGALVRPPDSPSYTLVAASDAPLPALPALTLLSAGGELEAVTAQKRHLESVVADLERRLAQDGSSS
jgi:hypothetical protein